MQINQKKLKDAMNRKGWNIQNLSFEARITYPTAHRIVKGMSKRLDLTTLERVCDALDISPNDLLERTSDDRSEVEAR